MVPATEPAAPLIFYPAYTFEASATWSKWVKLTAHDIHTALQPHSGFSSVVTDTGAWSASADGHHATSAARDRRNDASLLLFYNNHPIQFVQVVGVVVVLEDYLDKFWRFTIDDSSGATIDVTCRKPVKDEEQETHGLNGPVVAASRPANLSPHQTQRDAATREATEEQSLHQVISTLQIGTVIQAKGTLGTFRSTRQISLLRLAVIPDTMREMALVASRTAFVWDVLSKPWVLPVPQQDRLRKKARDEKDEEIRHTSNRSKREIKRRRREERHTRQIHREYEAQEVERQRAAVEAKTAAEILAMNAASRRDRESRDTHKE